jgi:AraC-like DNA-binding protein
MLNHELNTYFLIGMQLSFFGCGLCILEALEILFSPKKRSITSISFFVCNSIYLLYFGLYIAGIPQQNPNVSFLLFTSLFMLGPTNLFYYHELLYQKKPLPYRVWIHLIPCVICFIFEILFQFQPHEVKLYYTSSFFNTSYHSDPASYVLLFVMLASMLHLSIYLFYVIKIIISDINIGESRNEFKFIMYLAGSIFLNILIFLWGFIGKQLHIFVAACIMNVLVHVSIYISVRVYPMFFSNMGNEIRKKRYQKTMLKGLDTKIVCTRLMEIMQDEEVYTDSEITLLTLAEKLSLTTHQLSQLLNEHLNISFWDFINQFRIEKAKQIIIHDPGASMISTCYRVGFNNKTSFNAAFKKWAGMTPTEFRNGVDKFHPAFSHTD